MTHQFNAGNALEFVLLIKQLLNFHKNSESEVEDESISKLDKNHNSSHNFLVFTLNPIKIMIKIIYIIKMLEVEFSHL